MIRSLSDSDLYTKVTLNVPDFFTQLCKLITSFTHQDLPIQVYDRISRLDISAPDYPIQKFHQYRKAVNSFL